MSRNLLEKFKIKKHSCLQIVRLGRIKPLFEWNILMLEKCASHSDNLLTLLFKSKWHTLIRREFHGNETRRINTQLHLIIFGEYLHERWLKLLQFVYFHTKPCRIMDRLTHTLNLKLYIASIKLVVFFSSEIFTSLFEYSNVISKFKSNGYINIFFLPLFL